MKRMGSKSEWVLTERQDWVCGRRLWTNPDADGYCKLRTPVLHRVSRFSTGLKSRYSIANMTKRNRSVQAKTCAIENSPNQ